MIDYIPFNQEEFHRWINDSGDYTLRLNYDLTPSSVVIDAGGYLGQWAEDISRRYESIIFVLEPLSSLYENLENRFSQNPKVIPCNFAIGNKNCEMNISVDTDSSSLFNSEASVTETIQCVDVKDFLKDKNIKTVDLFKINIEGGEYDLLERLIELNLLTTVKNFQIQFHRFIPECDTRRKRIQDALSETHEQTWNYEWIWENWKLK